MSEFNDRVRDSEAVSNLRQAATILEDFGIQRMEVPGCC